MLLEFSVRNFRSFETEHKLSLVASSLQDHEESLLLLPNYEDVRVLRAAAIYGANGSGKSNFLQAIVAARGMLTVSRTMLADQRFRLSISARSEPTEFKFRFFQDGCIFEYSFATFDQKIVHERLLAFPKGRRQEWYSRQNDSFKFGSKLEGDKKKLAEMTRVGALFLAVAAEFNHPQLSSLSIQLAHWIQIVRNSRNGTTSQLLKHDPFVAWLSTFLLSSDLGIKSIAVKNSRPVVVRFRNANGELESRTEMREALTLLRLVRESNETAVFDLEDESDGTQRLYELLGDVYLALQAGHTLCIDELDASLHPHMTRRILQCFLDPQQNPGGAQLIFTTHDTTLLDQDLLRRDQIWFVEKDKQGASQLYSLHDFHPRKDASLERGYLAGRYGAIPFLGDLKFEWPNEKKNSKTEVEVE